jgi:hypothetical protein
MKAPCYNWNQRNYMIYYLGYFLCSRKQIKFDNCCKLKKDVIIETIEAKLRRVQVMSLCNSDRETHHMRLKMNWMTSYQDGSLSLVGLFLKVSVFFI